MRVAILSSFPPEVCGVGEYAEQQARRLERDGHEVDRIALDPLRWGGWTRAAMADVQARFAKAQRAIVHYQVGLFLDKTRSPRVLRFVVPHLWLRRLAARTPHLEVVVHESSWKVWRGRGERLQYPFVRRVFAAAPRLVFHTQAERELFERTFRLRRPSEVVPHEADFVPNTRRSKPEARRRLGIADGETLLLCIGFYAEAKGFEDAAHAFDALRQEGRLDPRARLVVLTSVREADDRKKQAQLDALRAWASGRPQLAVDSRYLSNEDFDDWIVAADLVLLPYRSSFGSGVAARARLLGTPVAASRVGGLPEQVGPGGRVFDGPAGLREVMLATAGAPTAPPS